MEGNSGGIPMHHRSFGTRNSLPGEAAIHGGALRAVRHGQARAERAQNRCRAASAVLLSTFSNLLSGVPATPPGCQILEGFGRLCRRTLLAEGPFDSLRAGPFDAVRSHGLETRRTARNSCDRQYCCGVGNGGGTIGCGRRNMQPFQKRGICCMKGFPGAPGSQG
jgi:hypothetical protein